MSEATAEECRELSGAETRKARRLVLIDAKVRRLAGSYARKRALLRTIGEESPGLSLAAIDHAVRQALAKTAGVCQGHTEHTEKGNPRCSEGRPKK